MALVLTERATRFKTTEGVFLIARFGAAWIPNKMHPPLALTKNMRPFSVD
jgi:hypothetical protein